MRTLQVHYIYCRTVVKSASGHNIRDRKKIFRYKEVYDLNITKDALNNWVITYMNVMDLHVLFSISSNELTKCLNITVKWLVENKYIIT